MAKYVEAAHAIMDEVKKAVIGKGEIKREEYQLCRKIYRQIKRAVSEDISFLQKIWWKYWRGILL